MIEIKWGGKKLTYHKSNRASKFYDKGSGFRQSMKTEDILSLTLKEFESELSPLNYEYVVQVYKSSLRAFIRYQEMAEFIGKDEFLDINEFFNINRETSKEYQEYLNELLGN